MKIKRIIRQHRRDFTAEYECEHCGHTKEGSGYDDAHYHEKVVPAMKCDHCGKVAPDDFLPRDTKYPAWATV